MDIYFVLVDSEDVEERVKVKIFINMGNNNI